MENESNPQKIIFKKTEIEDLLNQTEIKFETNRQDISVSEVIKIKIDEFIMKNMNIGYEKFDLPFLCSLTESINNDINIVNQEIYINDFEMKIKSLDNTSYPLLEHLTLLNYYDKRKKVEKDEKKYFIHKEYRNSFLGIENDFITLTGFIILRKNYFENSVEIIIQQEEWFNVESSLILIPGTILNYENNQDGILTLKIMTCKEECFKQFIPNGYLNLTKIFRQEKKILSEKITIVYKDLFSEKFGSSNVRSLNLSHNHITADQSILITKNFKNLVILDLSYNSIDSSKFSNWIKKLMYVKISTLYLSHNYICDSGIKNFRDKYHSNLKHLKKIHLDNNLITSKGLNLIVQIVDEFDEIDLSQNLFIDYSQIIEKVENLLEYQNKKVTLIT